MLLANDHLVLEVRPEHGMTIAALGRRGEAERDLLWRRPAHAAPPCRRALGPSGAGSIETLHDLLIGGWFEMSPHAGLPGSADGAATMLHGEAPRLPWEVLAAGPKRVEAEVRAVRWPLRLRREVALRGARVEVRSEIRNDGGAPLTVSQGEHPCFDRGRFAGGRISLRARRCQVLAPLDPANAAAAPGELEWPLAPAADGAGSVDLAAIPATADGSHDHVAIELAAPEIAIEAPGGPRLTLELDLACHPHVLLWRSFRAPSPPSFGAWDVFAVEPTSAPGRGFDDAVAAAAARRLEPGGAAAFALALAVS